MTLNSGARLHKVNSKGGAKSREKTPPTPILRKRRLSPESPSSHHHHHHPNGLDSTSATTTTTTTTTTTSVSLTDLSSLRSLGLDTGDTTAAAGSSASGEEPGLPSTLDQSLATTPDQMGSVPQSHYHGINDTRQGSSSANATSSSSQQLAGQPGESIYRQRLNSLQHRRRELEQRQHHHPFHTYTPLILLCPFPPHLHHSEEETGAQQHDVASSSMLSGQQPYDQGSTAQQQEGGVSTDPPFAEAEVASSLSQSSPINPTRKRNKQKRKKTHQQPVAKVEGEVAEQSSPTTTAPASGQDRLQPTRRSRGSKGCSESPKDKTPALDTASLWDVEPQALSHPPPRSSPLLSHAEAKQPTRGSRGGLALTPSAGRPSSRASSLATQHSSQQSEASEMEATAWSSQARQPPQGPKPKGRRNRQNAGPSPSHLGLPIAVTGLDQTLDPGSSTAPSANHRVKSLQIGPVKPMPPQSSSPPRDGLPKTAVKSNMPIPTGPRHPQQSLQAKGPARQQRQPQASTQLAREPRAVSATPETSFSKEMQSPDASLNQGSAPDQTSTSKQARAVPGAKSVKEDPKTVSKAQQNKLRQRALREKAQEQQERQRIAAAVAAAERGEALSAHQSSEAARKQANKSSPKAKSGNQKGADKSSSEAQSTELSDRLLATSDASCSPRPASKTETDSSFYTAPSGLSSSSLHSCEAISASDPEPDPGQNNRYRGPLLVRSTRTPSSEGEIGSSDATSATIHASLTSQTGADSGHRLRVSQSPVPLGCNDPVKTRSISPSRSTTSTTAMTNSTGAHPSDSPPSHRSTTSGWDSPPTPDLPTASDWPPNEDCDDHFRFAQGRSSPTADFAGHLQSKPQRPSGPGTDDLTASSRGRTGEGHSSLTASGAPEARASRPPLRPFYWPSLDGGSTKRPLPNGDGWLPAYMGQGSSENAAPRSDPLLSTPSIVNDPADDELCVLSRFWDEEADSFEQSKQGHQLEKGEAGHDRTQTPFKTRQSREEGNLRIVQKINVIRKSTRQAKEVDSDTILDLSDPKSLGSFRKQVAELPAFEDVHQRRSRHREARLAQLHCIDLEGFVETRTPTHASDVAAVQALNTSSRPWRFWRTHSVLPPGRKLRQGLEQQGAFINSHRRSEESLQSMKQLLTERQTAGQSRSTLTRSKVAGGGSAMDRALCHSTSGQSGLPLDQPPITPLVSPQKADSRTLGLLETPPNARGIDLRVEPPTPDVSYGMETDDGSSWSIELSSFRPTHSRCSGESDGADTVDKACGSSQRDFRQHLEDLTSKPNPAWLYTLDSLSSHDVNLVRGFFMRNDAIWRRENAEWYEAHPTLGDGSSPDGHLQLSPRPNWARQVEAANNNLEGMPSYTDDHLKRYLTRCRSPDFSQHLSNSRGHRVAPAAQNGTSIAGHGWTTSPAAAASRAQAYPFVPAPMQPSQAIRDLENRLQVPSIQSAAPNELRTTSEPSSSPKLAHSNLAVGGVKMMKTGSVDLSPETGTSGIVGAVSQGLMQSKEALVAKIRGYLLSQRDNDGQSQERKSQQGGDAFLPHHLREQQQQQQQAIRSNEESSAVQARSQRHQRHVQYREERRRQEKDMCSRASGSTSGASARASPMPVDPAPTALAPPVEIRSTTSIQRPHAPSNCDAAPAPPASLAGSERSFGHHQVQVGPAGSIAVGQHQMVSSPMSWQWIPSPHQASFPGEPCARIPMPSNQEPPHHWLDHQQPASPPFQHGRRGAIDLGRDIPASSTLLQEEHDRFARHSRMVSQRLDRPMEPLLQAPPLGPRSPDRGGHQGYHHRSPTSPHRAYHSSPPPGRVRQQVSPPQPYHAMPFDHHLQQRQRTMEASLPYNGGRNRHGRQRSDTRQQMDNTSKGIPVQQTPTSPYQDGFVWTAGVASPPGWTPSPAAFLPMTAEPHWMQPFPPFGLPQQAPPPSPAMQGSPSYTRPPPAPTTSHPPFPLPIVAPAVPTVGGRDGRRQRSRDDHRRSSVSSNGTNHSSPFWDSRIGPRESIPSSPYRN